MKKLPHPIPYQGSKRSLAPLIGRYLPREMETWYEPFAGSAAMSIWVLVNRKPKRVVLGDSLNSLMQLWQLIIEKPSLVAKRYQEVWLGQEAGDTDYFNQIRERFNQQKDPIDLLYLSCRCVKNAVRFNAKGNFTQSVDKRRLGMSPAKMSVAIEGASAILKGKTELRFGDWLETLADAGTRDFIYMDPPYLGTSIGKDKRYFEWMSQERLVAGLKSLNDRQTRFALSYDGMSGDKVYGPPLPEGLEMTRLYLHAGRSTQATLNGSTDETIESLYMSKGLAEPDTKVLRISRKEDRQAIFAY